MSFGRDSWRSPARGRQDGRWLAAPRNLASQDVGNGMCRYFQRGSCARGSRCRFSHDLSHSDRRTRVPTIFEPPAPEEIEGEEIYDNWNYLLRQPLKIRGWLSDREPDEVTRLQRFWSGATAILDSNGRESHQLLIKDLASGDIFSTQYIMAVLDLDLQGANEHAAASGFLKVAAHPALIDCLSAERYVDEFYQIIGSAPDDTILGFFTAYSERLHELYLLPSHDDVLELEALLCSVSTVISELFGRRRKLALHDRCTALLDAMDNAANPLDTVLNASNYQACKDKIGSIRRLIEISRVRIEAKATPSSSQVRRVSGMVLDTGSTYYPHKLDFPGNRHDNDHLHVGFIKILPTAAEIMSPEAEFLPSTDFRQPHFSTDPVQRYLDTHFRLLRHDIFGHSIDLLHDLLVSFKENASRVKIAGDNVRAYIYDDATISNLFVEPRSGLEAEISFSMPSAIRHKSMLERRAWWDQSKRLVEGAVVCFICSMGNRPMPLLLLVTEKSTDPSLQNTLVSHGRVAFFNAKLASLSPPDLELLVKAHHSKVKGILVDLPDLIPATFKPVLENLQRMSWQPLPFSQWIIPQPDLVGQSGSTVPPPRYARRNGFRFCLDVIAQHGSDPFFLPSNASAEDEALVDYISARSGLDHGQAVALISALTTEYALLQGPPGTGKSYLGMKLVEVLLRTAKLGPIIVICYTNHALDQFVERLWTAGIKRIIRIGSRSQASVLDKLNLATVSRDIFKTKSERRNLAAAYSDVGIQERSVRGSLARIRALYECLSLDALEEYLEKYHPKMYCQLFPEQEGHVSALGDPLSAWLGNNWRSIVTLQSGVDIPTFEYLTQLKTRANQDMSSLTKSERHILCKHWTKEMLDMNIESLSDELDSLARHRRGIDRIHNEFNRQALRTADVIAVTTTGLAKHISTLRCLQAKVVLCEEAAEVVEAHLISALMPGVEHFVQIGDHEQLRPQINNRSLSMEVSAGMPYQLDRSQFERLATGQPGLPPFPVVQLNVQRRMRPEISALIRDTVYPRLADHDCVKAFPDVSGMRHNVFWLAHNYSEDEAEADKRMKSQGNDWEVRMVRALVQHIVRQGAYRSTDIAVLTPYAKQLQNLRSALSRDFEIFLGEKDEEFLFLDDIVEDKDETAVFERRALVNSIRLATVDNFQGEEAKVVIVSLVRSNQEQKVGFLKTPNRINVLLSRAQHGMYLIGNADTYSNVPMWAEIRHNLEQAGRLGDAFDLRCSRHPEIPINCREPEDFARLSPEGGCGLMCDWRLESCGHQCSARCHSKTMHEVFTCIQPCSRLRATCGHRCPKLCGDPCGPCQVLIEEILLPCGHRKNNLRCHMALNLAKVRCSAPVQKTVPDCGHVIEADCSTDVGDEEFKCSSPCEAILPCGHQCVGSCGVCSILGDKIILHERCRQPCGRPYGSCEHSCRQRCHSGMPCDPCNHMCKVRCIHSQCQKRCREACAPCIETCSWSCEHQGSCSMPCAAPCDRLPCSERCANVLNCGHQCPGVCGETCPEEAYCQACGHHSTARVDLLEFQDYRDINLDKTPIVILSCGHFFTVETLDGSSNMNEVYMLDSKSGSYAALREPAGTLKVPQCPDCKHPIRQFATKRYGRIVNRAIMDEISTKFHVDGLRRLGELEADVRQVTEAPEGDAAWRTKNKIHQFCQQVAAEQQPTRKLFDAIRIAQSQSGRGELMDRADLRTQGATRLMPDAQIILAGRLIKLKLSGVILRHEVKSVLHQESWLATPTRLDTRIAEFMSTCEAVIEESRQENLPRMAVQGILAYARAAKCFESYCRSRSSDMAASMDTFVSTARKLLDAAFDLCTVGFGGSSELLVEAEKFVQLYARPKYELITPEEIESIKSAMVSGVAGMATHSGHWYKCPNGHTFAIGECGMPMERARCPECQAPIGGQNHEFVEGITRAEDMEI